ncbi:Kynurenine formamidase [Modicella reniformis]|uniref:Kynurenine formamidase n=1 Tax=Modicella reniformis TaxID=1440133 RepID=A0A9P6LS24_9FUNG|nr:Kynurenine formamidase [Modicella reniformis]
MSTVNDLVYAPVSDWEKHTFDLYYPSTPQSPLGSLIVFVHGGAWRTGDKSDFVDLARNLANSTGDVVAVVNYTLSIAAIKDDPTSVPAKAQHPKHVQDVAQALGYFYKNAQELKGYHRDRIFLVGHSAGGQIAGLLAVRPDLYLDPVDIELGLDKGTLHSVIRGVIGVEGIYNVDRLLKIWPSYRDFVIQGFGEDPQTLIDGSPDGQKIPEVRISGSGGTFQLPYYAVIHSNQDELVDPEQAKDYYAYLQSVVCGDTEGKVILEFGDWGTHDDMLQTAQFTRTITKYIHDWERRM